MLLKPTKTYHERNRKKAPRRSLSLRHLKKSQESFKDTSCICLYTSTKIVHVNNSAKHRAISSLSKHYWLLCQDALNRFRPMRGSLRHTLVLLDDLLDTGSRLALSLSVHHSLNLDIKTGVSLARLPSMRTVLAEEHFNLLDGLAAGLVSS